MSKKNELEKTEEIPSPERRKLLKKISYVAPTLIILGVAMPIANAYAYSSLPPGDPTLKSP